MLESAPASASPPGHLVAAQGSREHLQVPEGMTTPVPFRGIGRQ